MSRSDRVQRVERVFTAFDNHDPDSIMAEMAEGMTFDDPMQSEPLTREEFHEVCVGFFHVFPDARWETERMLTDADDAVAAQGTFCGTFEEPFHGMEPTGESVALPTVSLFTVSTDGITEWRDYWDLVTFRGQLGVE
jgi:steroid delta-isomerase-like uncharacterized protein